MSGLSQESLSQEFQRFAREEVHNSSPLYEKLSLSIAQDPEIVAVAAHARKGERVPNLFFAAVHFLLLKGAPHPVSAIYRSVSGAAGPDEDPYPKFRSFCLERRDEIRQLISIRLVQTNEVSRCVFLAPAFVFVSRQSQGRPLYLVEIGASAGLNLLWDRYGYKYGELPSCGNVNSPVQIRCSLRGNVQPPVPDQFPKVVSRVGIDLNPIDARDADATLWLRALIWPENSQRAELFKRAIQVAQQDPPRLICGDAAEALPALLAEIPDDVTLCIFRTFTALPAPSREQVSRLCSEYGAKRDLFLLSTRGRGSIDSELWLTAFLNGVKTETLLGRCHNHGEWLEWLGAR